jgi:hypothetical protein
MRADAGTIPVTLDAPRFNGAKWAALALTVIALAATDAAAGRTAAAEQPTKSQKKAEISYPEADQEARLNAPPAGDASLYVLRPWKLLGAAGCFGLEVDKKSWGALLNGQYSWDPLSPGEHSFVRFGKGVSLRAEPGQTYYLVISAGSMTGGGVRFVSPKEGEKIRKKLSLNPDRWLLRQYLANWSSVRVGMKLEDVQRLIRMSEGEFFYESGSEVKPIPGTGLGAIVGTGDVFRFRSMLGYSVTFRNGILAERHDPQAPTVPDGRGCLAPAVW